MSTTFLLLYKSSLKRSFFSLINQKKNNRFFQRQHDNESEHRLIPFEFEIEICNRNFPKHNPSISNLDSKLNDQKRSKTKRKMIEENSFWLFFLLRLDCSIEDVDNSLRRHEHWRCHSISDRDMAEWMRKEKIRLRNGNEQKITVKIARRDVICRRSISDQQWTFACASQFNLSSKI